MPVLLGASHQMASAIHNDNFCLCTSKAVNEARVNSIAGLPQSSSPSVASKLAFFSCCHSYKFILHLKFSSLLWWDFRTFIYLAFILYYFLFTPYIK